MRAGLVVIVMAVVLGGCGGGSGGPPPLDAGQVARGFAQATGDRLVGDPGAGKNGIQVLSLATATGNATSLQARYGSFSIFVVGDGADEKTLTRVDPDGSAVKPDARGIYWRQLSTAPPAWQAAKAYRNVVLQWEAGRTRRADARFDRLDAALARTVNPRAKVKLPAQDTPCAQLGIDPPRSGTGTCKEGAQTVVVTTRGHRLVLPDVTVTRVRVSVVRRVRSSGFGQGAVARGRFVIVRFHVANHADAPVDRVDPVLTIDPRRYATDVAAQLALQARSPLPLQPGEGADFVGIYDVPVSAAASVRKGGSLLLVGDAGSGTGSIDDASVVGRVRFGT
jgi:hypothetical protein